MKTRALIVTLHLISAAVAVITSTVQTRRILNRIDRKDTGTWEK
jgi:hypothetical protein